MNNTDYLNGNIDVQMILDNTIVPVEFLDKYNLDENIKKEIYLLKLSREKYAANKNDKISLVCTSVLDDMAVSDLKMAHIYGYITMEEFYEIKGRYCY